MNIVAIENEKYLIRPITESDKDDFMRIQQENSTFPAVYEEGNFRDVFWEESLKDGNDIYMMVFQKPGGKHIANCSVQGIQNDKVSIGIDVDKAFQNKGIGTEVMILLLGYLQENARDKRLLIKTRSDNIACRRMISKAGGIKIGEEPTPFDAFADSMLPTLQANGLTEEIENNKAHMDRNKGVYVYVYEFENVKKEGTHE